MLYDNAPLTCLCTAHARAYYQWISSVKQLYWIIVCFCIIFCILYLCFPNFYIELCLNKLYMLFSKSVAIKLVYKEM